MAGVLGLLGLGERALLWRAYGPVEYGDTASYLRLAGVLSGWSLAGYDGTRTPGYPAFLALLGGEPAQVWLAQMALGLGISLMLFWLTYRTTANARLALLVGGLYNLIPGQFLFEANLLSETLTAFLVLASITLLAALDDRRSPPGRWPAQLLGSAALGLAASLAGLVRPLFFFLPVWLLPFVGSVAPRTVGSRLARLAGFSLPPAILLGGWLAFIYGSWGMLSPTTMSGYHWVQHTGWYFELLPDEAAPIRDTYLQYRDARIAQRGDQTNAIWEAIPAISQASGLGFYDLSKEMQRLSFDLIREHPDLYLRNVVTGWLAFWKAPVYWESDIVGSAAARSLISAWATLGRVFSLAANAVFLFLTALALCWRSLRERLGFDRVTVAAVGVVWIASIVQTLVDHGDNPRFLVPLQMLVIYVVARASWTYGRQVRRS